MKIKVNKKLEIISEDKERFSRLSYKNDEGSLYVYGDLYGIYDGKRTYNQEDVIEKLNLNVNNLEKLLEIVRFSVGTFFVVVKNNRGIHIISTPSCDGVYYIKINDSLIISDDEFFISQHSNLDSLDENVISTFILNPLFLMECPPFQTFFKNVKKMPGGSIFTIKNDLSTDYDIYFRRDVSEFKDLEKVDPEKDYNRFKNGFEQYAQVVANNSKDTDMYMLFSGGIDSTCLLLSFLKTNMNIHPIFWHDKEKISQGIAREYCEQLNLELEVLPYKEIKMYEDKIRSNYKQFIEHRLFSGYIPLSEHFKENNIKMPLVTDGEIMDNLYHIRMHSLDDATRTLHPILQRLFSFPTILRYSLLFMKLVFQHRLKLSAKTFNKKHMNNFHDYLIFEIMGRQMSPRKEQETIRPFIKSEEIYKKLKNKAGLPVSYLNHLARGVRYMAEQYGHMTFAKHHADVYGYKHLHGLYPCGYLFDYFLKHGVTLKEAFFQKSHLYRYADEELKKRCNSSFYAIGRKALKKMNFKEKPLSVRAVKYVIIRMQSKPNRNIQSIAEKATKPMIDITHTMIDFDNLIIPLQIKNGENKKQIDSLFKKVQTKDYNITIPEYYQIQRLINLEVYLKSILVDEDLPKGSYK